MSRFRQRPLIAPLNQFVTENHIHTLLILFSAIVFVFFTSKDYIPFASRLFAPFLLLFLVTTKDPQVRVVLLFAIVLTMALNLWANFFVTANHGFMIAYIGLALMFACASGPMGSVIIARAAVMLISILMGLALIQKFVSPYYMNGTLIGGYLANGQMFKTLISVVIPEWTQIVHKNLEAQKTLMALQPAAVATVSVIVPPFVQTLALVLTYAALVSQAALELCILLRGRLGNWAHYAVMAFVLIIYSTRNENVFLSMNLILGFAMTDEATKSVRLWYVLGIAYLLIMEMMGLRPGIIG